LYVTTLFEASIYERVRGEKQERKRFIILQSRFVENK